MADEFANGVQRRYNSKMRRILRRSIPPSVRAIESASRRPTLCFAVRDDENKTGGIIVREKNLPAEVGKSQTPPRSASEVIAEMAAKVARYPAKPKEESEGMSAEEMYQRGEEHYERGGNKEQGEFTEAVKWFRRAAERGHNRASVRLGFIYCCADWVHRKEIKQNFTEAFNWYRRAAEQGNTAAQTRVGRMYQYGQGVSHNDANAVTWYRHAAKQGDIGAQNILTREFAGHISKMPAKIGDKISQVASCPRPPIPPFRPEDFPPDAPRACDWRGLVEKTLTREHGGSCALLWNCPKCGAQGRDPVPDSLQF